MAQERIDEIDKELEGYKDVIKTIDTLRKERTKLEKKHKQQLLQSLPLEEQFDKFLGSNRGSVCGDLFELKNTVPKFYERFIENSGLDRYRTYQICDMFEDTLSLVYEKDQDRLDLVRKECDEEDEDYDEYMNALREIARELMNNKIRGWVHDW